MPFCPRARQTARKLKWHLGGQWRLLAQIKRQGRAGFFFLVVSQKNWTRRGLLRVANLLFFLRWEGSERPINGESVF